MQNSGHFRLQTILKKLSGIEKIVLSILIISFAIRIGYLVIVLSQSPIAQIASFPPDTRRYIQLANDFYNLSISDESNLYMTGFGYALFIAAMFLVSGKSLLFALIAQTLLASFSTVILYKIGYLISRNRLLAVIAAGINATSFTSLGLSTSFLTETVFFFLLISSIYIFIKTTEKPTAKRYILLSILVAYAAFTRAVGQFIPLIFFAAVLLTPRRYFEVSKIKLVKYTVLSMMISIILMMAWAYRNYVVNDTFVLAGTGSGAAGIYLAARVAADRSDSLSVYGYRKRFREELAEWKNRSLTYGQINERFFQRLKTLFREDPISFINIYFHTVWENITVFDLYGHFRLPKYKKQLAYWTQLAVSYRITELMLCLSILGLFFLFYRGKVFAALLLALLYIYFVLLSGFTYWQGSRILYPAQASWALLIAAALFYPLSYAYRTSKYINWSKSLGYTRKGIRLILGAAYYPNKFLSLQKKHYNLLLVSILSALLLIFAKTVLIPALKSPVYIAVENTGIHSFDNQIELSQLYLESKNNSIRAIVFDLYTKAEIEENYRIFLHLYPENGGDMLNFDFAPQPPVTEWQPYVITTQKRPLEIEPGDYGTMIGFFNISGRLGESYICRITIK